MKSEHQQVLRTFWPAIRTQKMLLSSVFLTLLLTSIIRLLEPWPLALAVDFVLEKPDMMTFLGFRSGMTLSKTICYRDVLWVLLL